MVQSVTILHIMLQCGAARCTLVQCAAVFRSVLQCIAVHHSLLQCVAVCCSVLQCAAVCCSVLQGVTHSSLGVPEHLRGGLGMIVGSVGELCISRAR